jgi:mono/diheme cytochrome c family protein
MRTSSVRIETAVRMVRSLILLISLIGVAGCQKRQENASSPPTAQGNSAVAYGRKVFDAYGCARCHTIGSQGGRAGPDLTHVGADSRHTLDWLMVQVANPRAHNPSSRMPAFQGRISARDLMALAGYLTDLK